jgi:hypothetical protein
MVAREEAAHTHLVPLLAQFVVVGAELAYVQPTTARIELHTKTRIHSLKQQGDIALKLHVASVYFKYFNCFRGMLQVFYINVTKVD